MVVGTATVVAVAVWVGLLSDSRQPSQPIREANRASHEEPAAPARRFVRALLGLCLILLPEYAICVLAVGAVRGWLLTLTQHAQPRHAHRRTGCGGRNIPRYSKGRRDTRSCRP